MIWLFVVLYPILGFAFMLVGQVLYHKGLDALGYFEPEDDESVLRMMIMVDVLFWPVIGIIYMLAEFIPWLITFLYKLFVGIIFGTIALFKKENGEDGLE